MFIAHELTKDPNGAASIKAFRLYIARRLFLPKLFDVCRVFDKKAASNRSTMNVKMKCVALGLLVIAATAIAAEVDTSKLPPASDKKDLTFEKDIKPLFDKSCVKCHSGEKPKAKLRLDTLEGALKGSVDHKVIEPGNSAKSILVHNIAFIGDEDQWMPPPDNKDKLPRLTPEQIGLVRAWIDQGAK
jgi:hypothetical protein